MKSYAYLTYLRVVNPQSLQGKAQSGGDIGCNFCTRLTHHFLHGLGTASSAINGFKLVTLLDDICTSTKAPRREEL
jgi:hypothetical protein